MENRHQSYDLKQMQSLPLEAKIRMTKERIEQWYKSWTRFEIEDSKTGKIRYATIETRDYCAEPELKDTEWIKSAIDGQVYVSFSGGKDSTVLKHIVDSMYDDVPSLFVNTGLEYPEIQKFAMSQKNVITVRPEMRFDQVIVKYGYPFPSKDVSSYVWWSKNQAKLRGIDVRETGHYNRRFNPESEYCQKNPGYCLQRWDYLIDAPFNVSQQCCNVMKKKPAKKYERESGRIPILATMACESAIRKANWLKFGCNAFDSVRPTSQPMSFWTEQDVLEYIKKYDIPYCSVYGDIVCDSADGKFKTTGCERTGCVFCMFGVHMDRLPNRFQRLKETHPKQYDYCINGGEYVDGKWQPSKEGLGLGHVLDYIGVKY